MATLWPQAPRRCADLEVPQRLLGRGLAPPDAHRAQSYHGHRGHGTGSGFTGSRSANDLYAANAPLSARVPGAAAGRVVSSSTAQRSGSTIQQCAASLVIQPERPAVHGVGRPGS